MLNEVGTTQGAAQVCNGRSTKAIFVVLCVLIAVLIFGQARAGAQTQQPAGSYIHGTIDVVVSTRDGFVLATDSRATYSDGTYSDDAQKLFTVGSRAACVVAGTVGAEIGLDGFNLRDAIGTHLLQMDRSARSNYALSNAAQVAMVAGQAFGSVVGLWNPSVPAISTIVGEAVAVSVTENGEADWRGFILPIAQAYAQGLNYWTVGTPVLLLHSSSTLGLRFDVDAIGQPGVALKLLRAHQLGEDAFSRSKIMRKFYRLKKRGRLDDFRLADGIALARLLEEATIALSPPSAGVGGPIDIMILTKAGQKWVQKKETSAPFPPPWRVRSTRSTFEGGVQPLDGLLCLACSFKNVEFTFNGDGDVELVQPKFEGTCQLTLGPHARERMPHAVQLLENLLRGKCEIIGDQGH